jgi:predicted GNAT family acetyltransferase
MQDGLMLEARDNAARSQFEAYVDGRRVGELTYSIDGSVITLVHTRIQPEHERNGYGTALVTQALDLIRDTGMSVIPECDFAASVVRRNPQYRDLVKEV